MKGRAMRTIGLAAAALVATLVIAGGLVLRMQAHKQDTSGQAPVAAGQVQVVRLNLPEMDCAGCAVGVKLVAGKIDGVQDVKVDLEARIAEVSFDPSKTNAQAIANAVTQGTGFKTEVLKSAKKT